MRVFSARSYPIFSKLRVIVKRNNVSRGFADFQYCWNYGRLLMVVLLLAQLILLLVRGRRAYGQCIIMRNWV